MASVAKKKPPRHAATKSLVPATQLDFIARIGRDSLPYLKRHLTKAIPHLPRKLASVSFALVNDRTMADLHVQFMGIAGPTDVLTFELEHDARGRCIGGEVVVCVPYAKRTARQHGSTVERELLLYCLHGLLHLTGHDDRDDDSYRKMHAAEDRILTAIGVGPVFTPSPGTSGDGRDEGLPLRRRPARTRSARR